MDILLEEPPVRLQDLRRLLVQRILWVWLLQGETGKQKATTVVKCLVTKRSPAEGSTEPQKRKHAHSLEIDTVGRR